MKIGLKSIMALMALVLVIGCAPTSDNLLTSAGTAYVETLIKNYGKNTIQLDLSDANQYEYVKNAYLEAGQTPANSPELYADLEKCREADSKAPGREVVIIVDPNGIAPQAFMVSTVYTMPNDRFYVAVTSSVLNGSTKTTMRLRITDLSTGKILSVGPSGWVIQNMVTGGKLVTLRVDYALPNPTKWTAIKIEAIEQITVNGVVKTSSTIVKSLIGRGQDTTIEKILIQEPVDKNKDGAVTLAIGRDAPVGDACIPSVIDYPYEPGYFNKIKVPWKGYIQLTYPLTAAQIDDSNTYIRLSDEAYGGVTEMRYQGLAGQTFKPRLTLAKAPNGNAIISWNIPRKDCWFNNPALYRPLAKVNWYINFTFNNVVMADIDMGTMVYCASSDSNAANLLPDDSYPPYLTFCWSCVAEGSVITMADGSFLPIEKIKAGDKVRGKRMDLTVITVASGKESKPVIRIVDENAHNLLVTETHPMITKNRGMIAASQLKVGDMIVTEKGARKVVYLGTEKYEGKVYNLELGTPEEKTKMKKNADNLYYANGILVGDLVMQMAAEAEMQR